MAAGNELVGFALQSMTEQAHRSLSVLEHADDPEEGGVSPGHSLNTAHYDLAVAEGHWLLPRNPPPARTPRHPARSQRGS